MRSFLEIMEARGDTAVFTFGRFNPPTTGHEKLIMAIAKQQSKNAGSIMYVYPSHSQSPKKDPLPHAKKIAYMRKMFPKYNELDLPARLRTDQIIATKYGGSIAKIALKIMPKMKALELVKVKAAKEAKANA